MIGGGGCNTPTLSGIYVPGSNFPWLFTACIKAQSFWNLAGVQGVIALSDEISINLPLHKGIF